MMIGSLFISCRQTSRRNIFIRSLTDSTSVVYHEFDGQLLDTMLLPWPVYAFDTADLTGNGLPEIVVGVTKATRYWQAPARRLFIYKLFDGRYIRPLWLGSRVGGPLHDFHICHDSIPARIITTEEDRNGSLVNVQYRMGGFGIKYEKYLNKL